MSGRLTEITGIPCAGKTSAIQELAGKSSSETLIWSDSLVLGGSPRILNQGALLLRSLIVLTRSEPRARLKFYLRAIGRMSCTRKTKVYLLVNILLKHARYDFAKARFPERVVLFDEGISHIPFNLTDFQNADETPVVEFLELNRRLLADIEVVTLQVDQQIAAERLLARGHRRLKDKSEAAIREFVRRNQATLDQLVKHGAAVFGKIRTP